MNTAVAEVLIAVLATYTDNQSSTRHRVVIKPVVNRIDRSNTRPLFVGILSSELKLSIEYIENTSRKINKL